MAQIERTVEIILNAQGKSELLFHGKQASLWQIPSETGDNLDALCAMVRVFVQRDKNPIWHIQAGLI